ncbi:SWIM zinc finger family protein [Halospeciosus flavus]|uniref:SWIM zinc finger family protein n=1 Tax=Halospeciosus flavus TaxID=3032283 RepID=A0ABD5Z7L0_9EURY|nr:SWIM zinc finger family protein [Halospeciosus flavus]
MVPTKSTSTTPKRSLAPHAGADSRAARARAERMGVVPIGGGCYDVVTETDTVYTVDLPGSRCTCPDHRYRHTRCKHLRRVAIEVNEGEVPPPGKSETGCETCGKRVYATEHEPGPAYCEQCTLDVGDFVVDRERETLLVVARTTDKRADEVRVPGTDHTVAAHPTNRAYDGRDVVVEVMYPLRADVDPEEITGTQLERYSFPRARLEQRGRPHVER